MKQFQDVAFDLDDLLVKTAKALLRYYNSLYNTNYTIEDFPEYDMERLFDHSEERWNEFEFGFYASEFNAEIELKEGAKELVQSVRQKRNIHIITHRPRQVVSHTLYTISQHFNQMDFHKIHFSRSVNKSDFPLTKWEICKKNDLCLLVDDNAHHVNLGAQNGIPGILVEQPWNRNKETHPLVLRARNLYEVSELINIHH